MNRNTENNRILGCLLGGASGDALGYAVEFMSYNRILEQYGACGITTYDVEARTGKALISDDTQMMLFTAEGLLKPEGDRLENLYTAYQNWLITQTESFALRPCGMDSELLDVRALYARRAPGNTCLSALYSGVMGTIEHPINNSKGCGGVMRVAPAAFRKDGSLRSIDEIGIGAAAITHGHPLGYLSAGLLVHILHKVIYENCGRTLVDLVNESVNEFAVLFADAPFLTELLAIVRLAVELSDNSDEDVSNIRRLGEGWVAEETLAIALYCALRHADCFSAALIAAVNHSGDSDSTGAVTGNILGAYLGESAIEAKWRERLELCELISAFAERFYE